MASATDLSTLILDIHSLSSSLPQLSCLSPNRMKLLYPPVSSQEQPYLLLFFITTNPLLSEEFPLDPRDGSSCF